MRLSPAGLLAWRELQSGPVTTPAGALLARRLTDANLGQPVPPPSVGPAIDVTVVVPVRDRPGALERCLAGLGRAHPVVVVDDASNDPAATDAVAKRHGATVIRRVSNGGPGVARNTALAAIGTEYVAFLDSDCVPPPGWLDTLTAHLLDPLVAAVAPRIRADASAGTASGRFAAANGALDLGRAAARVVPGTPVAYVPTAALLCRRTALVEVAAAGDVFDPGLRHGEDVDLVWRLHAAGWRVRYEPAVEVGHCEPATWAALLRRRFAYGTSAAPLTRRHRSEIAPLVLYPWPTLGVAALVARRPLLALAAYAASVFSMRRRLGRAGLPAAGTPARAASALGQTGLGIGRYGTQYAAPLLAAGLARAMLRRRWADALTWGAIVLAGPVDRYCRQRTADVSLPVFLAGSIADDVAYGAGVWAGARRERSARALLPRILWRPGGSGAQASTRPPAGRHR